MCCRSLFELWKNGDLLQIGDGLLITPQGVVVHESEVVYAEQIRSQFEAEGIVPDAVVFDSEGKYRSN